VEMLFWIQPETKIKCTTMKEIERNKPKDVIILYRKCHLAPYRELQGGLKNGN
jgi:hypothetical protein